MILLSTPAHKEHLKEHLKDYARTIPELDFKKTNPGQWD